MRGGTNSNWRPYREVPRKAVGIALVLPRGATRPGRWRRPARHCCFFRVHSGRAKAPGWTDYDVQTGGPANIGWLLYRYMLTSSPTRATVSHDQEAMRYGAWLCENPLQPQASRIPQARRRYTNHALAMVSKQTPRGIVYWPTVPATSVGFPAPAAVTAHSTSSPASLPIHSQTSWSIWPRLAKRPNKMHAALVLRSLGSWSSCSCLLPVARPTARQPKEHSESASTPPYLRYISGMSGHVQAEASAASQPTDG